MFLVDTHCHLDQLDDFAKALTHAKSMGVQHFLCVCITLKDFPAMLAIAKKYAEVSASVGLHPNESVTHEPTIDDLIALAQDEKVIAIGETGLDYFRSKGDLTWQHDRFRTHIQVAKKLNKPLIVHMRDAKEDTLTILKEEKADEVSGIMHCFTEDWETATRALDLNFYISISGIVTFKNATHVQEVAKRVPLNRLLIETDSPYLAPVPHRGKLNEPAYVRYVAECIAELRNITVEEIAEHTTDNFFTLFKGLKHV